MSDKYAYHDVIPGHLRGISDHLEAVFRYEQSPDPAAQVKPSHRRLFHGPISYWQYRIASRDSKPISSKEKAAVKMASQSPDALSSTPPRPPAEMYLARRH